MFEITEDSENVTIVHDSGSIKLTKSEAIKLADYFINDYLSEECPECGMKTNPNVDHECL
jgi:hypothetical protein